jgi:hypothetical protein
MVALSLFVLGRLRGEQLQGHHPLEHDLVRQVDNTHPTTAQHPLDPETEQLTTDAELSWCCQGSCGRIRL